MMATLQHIVREGLSAEVDIQQKPEGYEFNPCKWGMNNSDGGKSSCEAHKARLI